MDREARQRRRGIVGNIQPVHTQGMHGEHIAVRLVAGRRAHAAPGISTKVIANMARRRRQVCSALGTSIGG